MKARAQRALVVAILLLAAGLRSYRLTDFPPGVEHDEVAEWQIARGILTGHHALFFREAYGQEPAYLYLQAISISLLGDNVFALRFASFAVAMLTLAACYRLMRRLFGPVAALTSLALIAVTLWPLFFARVAIRGMTLPLVMCLAADSMFIGIQPATADRRPQTAVVALAVAGVWFGISAYTYLAARAIPILLIGFAVCLVLFAREQMRGKWTGLALMLVIAALIAAPITFYVSLNPDLQFRVDEVSGPLKQLQQGDASGVLGGVRDTLLMFSVRGDQTVRDNWPYRPVFADPLSATLFYIGLLAAIWRWRKIEYAFMLMWLIALLLPTMVTAAPPNFVRTLGALPPIFALPGIGVATIGGFLSRKDTSQFCHSERSEESLARKTEPLRRSPAQGDRIVWLGVLAVSLALTVQDYFFRWPAHPETQFVWQTDLATVAGHLDSARDVPTDIAVSGLSNETMDDDSLRLLMKRRDLRVRWFDSRTTLILPSGKGRMFIPRIVPLDPLLHARLIQWGAQEHSVPSGRLVWFDLSAFRITGIQMAAMLPAGASTRLPLELDNGMSLLGYEASNHTKPGDEVTVLTYWQVKSQLPPHKAFVHLTDVSGKLFAQSDGLNAPPQFWQSGDMLIQLHRIQLPPDTAPGNYYLQAGLYESRTNTRAQFKASSDHLVLGEIIVQGQ